ncbi:hypothetical protein SCP_0703910 [Sparassis crispa]|uniref:N-acetyltransferase domain-containing protein n=1 Tax=Sparassis crispa TaxID=139825 RepID=A0A401GSL0_9APHY|nr:hypothetical protein SCP_0703910 [Sparassis crispa]GBE85205.1 hypothetical protein SCP_0703910 [Sparassis crispa]
MQRQVFQRLRGVYYNVSSGTPAQVSINTVDSFPDVNAWLKAEVQQAVSNDYVGMRTKFVLEPPAVTALLRAQHYLGQPEDQDGTVTVVLTADYPAYGDVLSFLVKFAFTELSLHRLSCTIFNGDEKLAALYKACGFVEEGRRRKANRVNGEWCDEILLSILEEEWTAREHSAAQ